MVKENSDYDYIDITENLVNTRRPKKQERLQKYDLGCGSLIYIRNRLVILKTVLALDALIKKSKKIRRSEFLKLKNKQHKIFLFNNKYIKPYLPHNYIILLKKKRPITIVCNGVIYDTIVKLKVEVNYNNFESFYYGKQENIIIDKGNYEHA